MDMVKDALVSRLKGKGLPKGMVSGFLQSLSSHFSAEPRMGLSEINQKLQNIGWNEIELDYHTYQLARTWHEMEEPSRRPFF